MSDIEKVISKADGYIKDLIDRMIKARLLRINASEKILDVIADRMEDVKYSYRLGESFDPMVKVESENIKQSDVLRPRYQLKYAKTPLTLLADGQPVKVPNMPDFIFESWIPTQPVHNRNQLIDELFNESLKDETMLKAEKTFNPEEEPDYEDAFWKFFSFASYSHFASSGHLTLTPPNPILWFTTAIKPKSIDYEFKIGMQRYLTVNGEARESFLVIWVGRVLCDLQMITANGVVTHENVEHFGFTASFATQCPEIRSVSLLGREIPRGKTERNGYYFVDIVYILAGDQVVSTYWEPQ